MELKNIDSARDLTLEETAQELFELRGKIKNLHELERYLTVAVVEGLKEMGATRFRIPEGLVLMTEPVVDYDRSIMAGLREITDPEDLKGAYVPEHSKIVPEKWDGRGLKRLKNFGADHRDIINDGEIRGNPRITLTQTTEKEVN